MKYVLALASSPRKGNSEWMLKRTIQQMNKSQVKIEVIRLADLRIQLCDGCLRCEENGECYINDDMSALYDKILAADALLIAIPVRFDSVPSSLKNFIDRLNPLLFNDRLKGKHVGVLIVGQLTGKEGKASRKRVLVYMKNVAEICKMNFLGSVEAEGRMIGDAKIRKVEVACARFGERLGGELIDS